jgi:hypothetical protein
MSVPIILAVHFFLHVAVFVIAPNQDVAIIAIIRHDLVEAAVRFFENSQLRVASCKSHRSYSQDGQHGDAAHHPSRESFRRVSFRIGQHVGVPS